MEIVDGNSHLEKEQIQKLWEVNKELKSIQLLACTSCSKLFYMAKVRPKWESEHNCPENSCQKTLVSIDSLEEEDFKKVTSFGGQISFSYPEDYLQEQLELYEMMEEEEGKSTFAIDSFASEVNGRKSETKEPLPSQDQPSTMIAQEDFKKLYALAIIAVAGILIMATVSILSLLQSR